MCLLSDFLWAWMSWSSQWWVYEIPSCKSLWMLCNKKSLDLFTQRTRGIFWLWKKKNLVICNSIPSPTWSNSRSKCLWQSLLQKSPDTNRAGMFPPPRTPSAQQKEEMRILHEKQWTPPILQSRECQQKHKRLLPVEMTTGLQSNWKKSQRETQLIVARMSLRMTWIDIPVQARPRAIPAIYTSHEVSINVQPATDGNGEGSFDERSGRDDDTRPLRFIGATHTHTNIWSSTDRRYSLERCSTWLFQIIAWRLTVIDTQCHPPFRENPLLQGLLCKRET